MKRPGKWRVGVLFVTMIFFSTSWACVSGDGDIFRLSGPRVGPPPHAPAHGYRAKYRYWYYPTAQVYFDFSRKVYFYMHAGRWIESASLPGYIRVRPGDRVEIGMDTDRPYTKFYEHRREYPPGQVKKEKHHWNHRDHWEGGKG